MYALVNQNQVILTQGNWNPIMFNNVLAEECGVYKRVYIADEANVPLIFNDETKILKYFDLKPNYNSRIEWIDGPTYEITENHVVGSYIVKQLDLDIAKGNLKNQLPGLRYGKEIQTIQAVVQNKFVTIRTDRDTRAVLSANALGCGDGYVNWKFDNEWLQLTKDDLISLLQQTNQSTQEAYDWEYSKMIEIDNCKTLEQIDKIVIHQQIY
jgi:hypothetical protein